MPVSKNSRYLRVPRISVEDATRGQGMAYEQRDTTVFEADFPKGTVSVQVMAADDFPTIARRYLGTQFRWWMLADMNPDVFYPLDLTDGARVNVPPARSISRFRRT